MGRVNYLSRDILTVLRAGLVNRVTTASTFAVVLSVENE